MKSRRCVALALVSLALVSNRLEAQADPASEAAPEKTWSLEAGGDFATHYLFRGVDLLGGEAALVPHALLSTGNWAFSYYGYIGDLTPRGRYREHDFTADYTFSFGNLSLTTGALTYLFNGSAEDQLEFFDTYEVYAIASWDLPLAPTVSYYHDIDEVDGGYLQAGISHDVALCDQLTLSLSGALGIDFGYNSPDSSGDLDDLLLGLDLSWAPNDAWSLHALLQRSIALDALDDIGQDDLTVASFGLSHTF